MRKYKKGQKVVAPLGTATVLEVTYKHNRICYECGRPEKNSKKVYRYVVCYDNYKELNERQLQLRDIPVSFMTVDYSHICVNEEQLKPYKTK